MSTPLIGRICRSLKRETPLPLTFGDNLLAWWDATDLDTIRTTGSLVDSWRDKKHGYLFVGSGTARPTFEANKMNGVPAITFSGTNQMSTGTSEVIMGTDKYTVFIVASVEGASSEWARILSFIATGDTYPWATAESAILITRNSTTDAICSFSNSVPRSDKALLALGLTSILAYSRDGNDGIAAVDGVDGTTTAVVGALGATGQLNVGADGVLNNPYVGTMSEIIIINGVLTTEERTDIEGYLAWKYKLEVNLPADHPQKNIRPKSVSPLPLAATRLTFCYGADPANIEGLNDTSLVGAYLAANFDHVVLGMGLENPLSLGHSNAIAVVAAAKAINPNIRFYGYVHMSPRVDLPPNYTVEELETICTQWATLVKTDGVFMDECESGFETYIPRINAILDHIHSITSYYNRPFVAIVNGWDHSEFISNVVDETKNPLGEYARIHSCDFLCHESQTFNNSVDTYMGSDNNAAGSDGYAHANFIFSHSASSLQARRIFNCGFVTVNVYDVDTTTEQQLTDAWTICKHVGEILGNSATAMCVKDFGASGSGANKCPAFDHNSYANKYISSNPIIAGAIASGVTNGKIVLNSQKAYESTYQKHEITINGDALPSAPDITQSAGSGGVFLGMYFGPITVFLTDPDPAEDVTVVITLPANFSLYDGSLTLLFPAHQAGPQVTGMLEPTEAGWGTFTYTVDMAGATQTTGSFDYFVNGGAT